NALLASDPLSGATAGPPADASLSADRIDPARASAPPFAANDETGMPGQAVIRPALGRIVGLTLAGALVGASLAFAMPSGHVATAELLIEPASDARSNGQLSPDAA